MQAEFAVGLVDHVNDAVSLEILKPTGKGDKCSFFRAKLAGVESLLYTHGGPAGQPGFAVGTAVPQFGGGEHGAHQSNPEQGTVNGGLDPAEFAKSKFGDEEGNDAGGVGKLKYCFFVEGRGLVALVSDGLEKQGDLAECVSESSTRELLGTHGHDAAGCACVGDYMGEQSYLATSVSKSSTGELLGTHGWYAADGALVGDDLKQSYLGVERGESLDEAAAAPMVEFVCDGWARVERSEFLDEAAAAPTAEFVCGVVARVERSEFLDEAAAAPTPEACMVAVTFLEEQGNLAASFTESSTRELSGTHGDGAAGSAYVGNDLEQSYFETSVSKSSTGELSGTLGRCAAGCAFVGDDWKKQSYLGVERGESLDEAAAAPTAEFGCDGWTRVERSEFLDEAAAAPTAEFVDWWPLSS